MYLPEESQLLKQSEKYHDLLDWGLKNGVKMKYVDMPAVFEHGLIGVVSLEDIPANTAIICVPQSLIISQEKCLRSDLKPIYVAHPELFDEDVTSDAEFNVLILYLFAEKKKGKDSFFYPYIAAIQANNMMINWSEEQLKAIEDPLILEEYETVRDDLLELWEKAKIIIEENEQYFGQNHETDKEDFYWAAQSVMSRCFGWSLKSTSMVPIADFLNHSNVACTHNMVHRVMEIEQNAHEQYILKNKKLNLSALGLEAKDIPIFEDHKLELLRKENLDDLHIQDLSILNDEEQRALINKINYDKLRKDEILNVWDLSFATSSDSEDNDSDEEIDELRNKQFINLLVKETVEWKERKTQQPNTIEVCLNQQKQNVVKITGLPIQIPYQEGTIQEKQLDLKKQQEEVESSESEESQWDWLDEDDKEGYFCITTNQAIKKHQQVNVSYGRRTNRFLLSWYGFALPDNKYSSFNFRLWLNVEIFKELKHTNKELFDIIVIKKTMSTGDWDSGFLETKQFKIPIEQVTKEFRLKKHKLNNDLLMYLRLYLMVFYTGKDVSQVLITIPVSIDYEIFVMQFTIKLLTYFLNQFSQGLGEDNDELQKDISAERRFAIYINRERKEILISQILLILECIIILKKYKEISNLKAAYLSDVEIDVFKKMDILKSLKQYLKTINEFM